MGRGLGPLQREILDALDASHEAEFIAHDYRLVYDLSAVKETLVARGHGRLRRLSVPELNAVYVWHSGAFEASFSRAIRTLIARGLLRSEWSPRHKASWTHTYFVSRFTEHTIRENYQAYCERLTVKYQCDLETPNR